MDSKIPSDSPPDYDASAAEHGLPAQQGPRTRRGPQPLDLPILSYMRSKRTILASASPRRKYLLAQIGLTTLEILPSTKPENLSKTDLDPHEYVAATARQKCLDVYQAALDAQEASTANPPPEDPALVIAADTIVVTRAGKILEKPHSEAEHVRMLRHMRDTHMHRVLTAVCVLAPKADASHPGYEIAAHVEETRVYFAQADDGLPDEVIDSYIRTREGVDKAGGYALQGIGGAVLVERVEGSVDNVVGLPVRKCLQLCEKVVFMQGEYDAGDADEEEE
ncbi:putative acetylserotonin methytransferase-like protein [Thozetella sp. PMI_491]|nr:putative acetylserotonin methytransferase-like protein [Thozetella sp. PMI_491]